MAARTSKNTPQKERQDIDAFHSWYLKKNEYSSSPPTWGQSSVIWKDRSHPLHKWAKIYKAERVALNPMGGKKTKKNRRRKTRKNRRKIKN